MSLKVTKKLFDAFLSGDEKACEEIFTANYQNTKAFIWKIIGTEHEADELTQSTYILLWENRQNIKSHTTFYAYLYQIARSVTFRYIRNRRERKQIPLEKYHSHNVATNPEIIDDYNAQEVELLLQLGLDNMHEQQRKIFLMHQEDEMSPIQIAEKEGLSIRTVENYIYRARVILKERIDIFAIFLFVANCLTHSL